MPVQAIPPSALRRICQHPHFTFETTAEIDSHDSIIGQPRGTRAIEFGIAIQSQGYNMFVLGESGTGRTTAIKRFLEQKTASQSAPSDWIYVNNFAVPYQPRAIRLPAGGGAAFQSEMRNLLERLQGDLPKAFDSDTYRDAMEALARQFDTQQEELFQAIQQKAAEQSMALVNTPSGPMIAPLDEAGQVMTPESFQQLPPERQAQFLQQQELLQSDLEDAIRDLRSMDSAHRAGLQELNRTVAGSAIEHHFTACRQIYREFGDVLHFLEEMQADVLENLDAFLAPASEESETTTPFDFRRYEVNLFVDHSQTSGAPVLVESNPTLPNLAGRMEYEMRFGVMSTHFMNLKAGCLHRANGGYLVLNARDLLSQGAAWEALKRAIDGRVIRFQTPEAMDGAQVLAKSLDPEPIPLSIKVILLGSPGLYYALYEQDEDFGELFKVRADFDTIMPRDDAHEFEYARFVANRCREEGLRHFDRPAVEKIVEFGSQQAGDQDRLSTRFGELADIVREASFWAGEVGRDQVGADDVRRALTERVYRANRVEERTHENFAENVVFIATSGSVVGQVNSLSVIDLGDYSFGQPGRLTARAYMGKDGVVNIEREVEMAGPLHNKGLLTLIGYLGGQYARSHALSLSASLTFEQNYAGIDGDSASAAELFALLSAIGGLPLRQDIAVTGSINQHGEVQPVGGVVQKIEGFFRVCAERGLTGSQGVLLPAANRRNLMLQEEVIAAVDSGQFHIWAIDHVDDGIEMLTGIPAGQRDSAGSFPPDSVHGRVQQRLQAMAQEPTHPDEE